MEHLIHIFIIKEAIEVIRYQYLVFVNSVLTNKINIQNKKVGGMEIMDETE